MYIYPENMKANATLFMWRLFDMIVIAIGTVISLLIFVNFKNMVPLCCIGVFAFVSIRLDEISIFDYIKFAFRFLILEQQMFIWGCDN